jgi:hypothetical protein
MPDAGCPLTDRSLRSESRHPLRLGAARALEERVNPQTLRPPYSLMRSSDRRCIASPEKRRMRCSSPRPRRSQDASLDLPIPAFAGAGLYGALVVKGECQGRHRSVTAITAW